MVGYLAAGTEWCVASRLRYLVPEVLKNSYVFPDDEAIRLAGPPPPTEETFERAVRWAFDAGHLTTKQVGKLALAAG